MIPTELKELCEELLTVDDYKAIAAETNFSFQYVKDIKNQYRFNLTVASALRNACIDKASSINSKVKSLQP